MVIKCVVAGATLPVCLEDFQKVKGQELLGFEVTQRSTLGRVEGRNMKFSVQLLLLYLDSGKNTERDRLWDKCVWEDVKPWRKSTVLREVDLTALLSNSKLIAGITAFNQTSVVRPSLNP